jgi:hypothetical protein
MERGWLAEVMKPGARSNLRSAGDVDALEGGCIYFIDGVHG